MTDSNAVDLLHLDMRAERRKIQNRVNQRTYRMRQSVQKSESARPRRWKVIGSLSSHHPAPITGDGGAMQASSTLPPPPPPLSFSHSSDHALYQTREFQRDAIVCRLAPPHGGERARQFELAAYRHYMQGTPQVDQLLTLVKLNVYRALAANLNALGMTDIRGWMHPDATSAFATLQPSAAALDRALPKHLQPTAIQRAVPHHPWLDFFPHPRMRDRLIVAGDQFDDEELCVDIMGFWTAGKEDPALIVWGPPWDIANWEMSDAFVRKWGWTVKDCPDLFRATNTWRALRGDKRLCSR